MARLQRAVPGSLEASPEGALRGKAGWNRCGSSARYRRFFFWICGLIALLDGLYKVEYGVNDAFGRSIMCLHDGKMLGGNSGFAHLGTYSEQNGEIVAEVITERHNLDPGYKPLMGADVASIGARGRLHGNEIRLQGGADTMPGAHFWANLTRLDDGALPPRGAIGQGGIANGLYGMSLRALDGVDAGLSGVMLLIDGRILGGDAFFYYLGSYSRPTAAGRARC